MSSLFFFFNGTATTEIYTLSLHDALPIWGRTRPRGAARLERGRTRAGGAAEHGWPGAGARRDPARRADRDDRSLGRDRKSTRLNSSHANISYAVFCLTKSKNHTTDITYTR